MLISVNMGGRDEVMLIKTLLGMLSSPLIIVQSSVAGIKGYELIDAS